MTPNTRIKKVGLLLSGCGRKDGTEIHEAISAMLVVQQLGAEVICIAPDAPQHHVSDHSTGKINFDESRNIISEAARIARKQIFKIQEIDPEVLDAVIIPGGYGTTFNLSDYASEGQNAIVLSEVRQLVTKMHSLRKLIGGICFGAVIIALSLKEIAHVDISFGNNIEFSRHLISWGMKPQECNFDEIITDFDNLVVTTPAYIYDVTLAQAHIGIEKLVTWLLKNN